MRRWFVFLVLLLSVVGLAFLKRPTIETSLFALIGEEEMKMHPEVLNRGSGEIQVLVSAASTAEAESTAEAFYQRVLALDQAEDCFQTIRFKLDAAVSQEVLDFYQTYSTGLLAPEDATLLAEGKTKQLCQQAIRHWYVTPGSLYTMNEDPFHLVERFVRSRPLVMSGWTAELNGYLSTTTPEGEHALLLSLALEERFAQHPDALMPIVAQLKRIATDVQRDAVKVSLSGVPLHTVEVAGKCKEEITWLSIFSVIIILVTAWMALKSWRIYPYGLFVLGIAGSVGAGMTLLCCDAIHLLAGVFATTLLGLTIDYAFHGFLATDARHVRKHLFYSWLTTEVSLLPLLFSGMPILEQSAIFMMSGLFAALVGVLLTVRSSEVTVAEVLGAGIGSRRWVRALPIVLFIALVPTLFLVHFGTDLKDFHSPSEELLAAEERFYTLTFPEAEKGNRGLLVIEGKTIEEALQREEALSLPATTSRISHFLPSLATRQARMADLENFYATEQARFLRALPMEHFPPLEAPQPWTYERLPKVFRENFFLSTEAGSTLIVIPNVERPEILGEGVSFYQPQQVMQATVDTFAANARHLLLLVGGVLLVVLLLLFKGRALKLALPSLLAVMVVFLLFGTGGRTLNLFHLLACFMLIGMSLDYTIFFASGDRRALRPVTCSFITSLAGFGALAFVSFMVVQSMGEVFAVGLTVAYVSAFLLFWGEQRKVVKETEVAASPLGLTVVLWIYRLLGKRALDVSGWVIAHCVWLTSPKVRRFTQSRKRLVLFVQSMVDKFVVMSQGRGQPSIEIEAHPETEAFLADVRQRKGVFLLSSHFGAVEVLPAILQHPDVRGSNGSEASAAIPLYAFMRIEQTAVFNRFYLSQMKQSSVHLRPVAGFGMAELFEAGTYFDEGGCILMAGDRALGTQTQQVTFLGREVAFPRGVYRFAKLLEHPIYLVVCYRVRRQVYRLAARAIAPDAQMVESFVDALEPFVKAHPEQWYHWEMLS